MRTHSQKIRLGIFLLLSISIFVLLIAFFTTREIFRNEDPYYIVYENISVSGLEVGSPVKYLGIRVGTIDDLWIDPDNVGKVVVKVALDPGTPIKEDAKADIATIGITGLKMIEIRGGSQRAETMAPGDTIKAGSSITEEITGRAEVIAEKIEKVLNNLQLFTRPENLDKLTEMTNSVTEAFVKLDLVIEENRSGLKSTVSSARQIAGRLDTAVTDMQKTMAEVRQIVLSDTVAQILISARDISQKMQEANIKSLIEELGEVVQKTNTILLQLDKDLDRGSMDFVNSMEDLSTTIDNLEELSRLLRNDPSLLIRGRKIEGLPDAELQK